MTLVVLACVTDASTLTKLMMVAIFFHLSRDLFAIRVRVSWLLELVGVLWLLELVGR